MNIKALYDLYRSSQGVTTDTRNIIQDGLFFALKGESFNGNNFVEEALSQGAKACIIDEEEFFIDDRTVLVRDVLKSLQELANFHRKQFNIPFIGITGTNGKTTTKELVLSVLSQSFKTYATKGNFNNHLGVPLTILSIPLDTEMAIIEMGANHPGEIEFLCQISEPNFGLITNIGRAHLEGFGSYEGVKQTKGELYQFIRSIDGTLFVNADLAYLVEMSNGTSRVFYGKDTNLDYSGQLTESFPYLKLNCNQGLKINSQVLGVYNFDNIMTAFAIGKHFGMPDSLIKKGIESYHPSSNRSQLLDFKGGKVILDAYNANPSSMEAAITNFISLPYSNRCMILGDMFELGSEASQEHESIIHLIQKNQLEAQTILVGEHFQEAILQLKLEGVIRSYKNTVALKEWFDKQNYADNCYLIKGSRGIALEKILE